jgi:hypothetical protein
MGQIGQILATSGGLVLLVGECVAQAAIHDGAAYGEAVCRALVG